VSAAGRFEPLESVTRIAAPYIDGHPAMIASIAVHEGQQVSKGQIIATLAGKQQMQAAVQQARARVALQQVKLNQATTAPRRADTAVLKDDVARLQTSLAASQADLKRYQTLRATRDVSQADVDSKRLEVENTQQTLDQAKARLAGLSETRSADVQTTQAELDEATADLRRQQLALQQLEVLAPVDGTILRVRARAGEEVGPDGIAELAQTATMGVIAEVYETDVNRIKAGQSADIRSDALPPGTQLHGTVVQVGDEVGRAAIVVNDPAAFADARIVPVKIRLSQSEPAASLIHGKVSVIIHPAGQ
jgi:HlyD family secretion protein